MIDIVICMIIIYSAYYFVSISKYDENGHVKKKKNKKDKNNKSSKKDKNKEKVEDYQALPTEVKYFVSKYKVDLDKINLKALLKVVGFVLGLDITFVTLLSLFFLDDIIWQVILASILIIPVYLISLKFLGDYFKKKGLIKDV